MFFRKKVLLAKTESTYGTDSTPAATDAVLTKNLSIQPYAGPVVSRDLDKSTLGAESQINTAPMVTVSFDVEFAGSGAAGTAPAWGYVLEACGFSETINAGTSVVFAPLSASFPSLTMKFYLDGQEHAIVGARGTAQLSLTRGQLPMISFTFTGLYTQPTAVALPTEDVSDYIAPVAVTQSNTPTFTIGATSLVAESLSINLNNNVVHRNIIGSDQVSITDRNVTGSLVIEAPAIGTKNWFADVESDNGVTTAALSLVHGTTAGNILTIGAPVVQLTSIVPQDSDGIVTYSMDAVFIPSSGDDELTITNT